MQFPQMVTVRQRFDAPRIDDIPAVVAEQMRRLHLTERIQPGRSVAITAGSRGIANIPEILAAIVVAVKDAGGSPFIVPAMGSHGGGTVDGQLDVLRQLGVTEQSVGAPIRATMDTVIVAETSGGIPVHFDRFAHEADHVLVVNRIKPHTGFVGSIESGLHKMMLIGLGNHNGASLYHRAILKYSFSEILTSVADTVLRECGIVGGIAIVENARDETALVEAVMPDDFAKREEHLLKQAVDWLPSLPVRECDLLIVDRIGKNISGTGMDTNVVGRKYNDHKATEQDRAACLRIMVRSLTDVTQGNACGIGIAEFTTQRCVDAVDFEKTRINCVTSQHPTGCMIPATYPTDREAIQAALQTIGLTEPHEARVVQISDTQHLESVRVSEACLSDIQSAGHIDTEGPLFEFPLDSSGRLADVT